MNNRWCNQRTDSLNTKTLKGFNFQCIKPFQGFVFVYFGLPAVAPLVIHIQSLTGLVKHIDDDDKY